MKCLRNMEEESDYYCLVQCDCGRKYKPEEMFLCYCCSKIKCNFCLITEANIFRCKGVCNEDISSTKKIIFYHLRKQPANLMNIAQFRIILI